jgi:formylglycine-generating enzyme required for sulfatase activity
LRADSALRYDRLMQRHKLAGATLFVTICLLTGVYACSGDSKPPPQLETRGDGSTLGTFDGTVIPEASGGGDSSMMSTDSGGVDGGDAGVPPSCSDTILDNLETDVDCGGTVCHQCIDGKKCVASTDCVGGFCDPIKKKCATPSCTDTKVDGKETDVDCGGGTCAKCSFGKKCILDGDCVSGKCDTNSKQCNCPDRMITVATNGALGGAYCIDETEVANGDYDRFVRANQSISQQDRGCAMTNTNYTPSGAWPPVQPLSVGYALPVRYVDWCDATAFCLWAGKQLCGAIGGTSIDISSDAGDAGGIGEATSYVSGAWMNACSAEGQNTFPYGTTYDGSLCNGQYNTEDAAAGPFTVAAVSAWNDTGTFQNIPTGPAFRACQGGSTGLYGMSGNVAEWEDACTTDSSPSCLARGGSYLSNQDTAALACSGYEQIDRMTRRADLGFRCCQF